MGSVRNETGTVTAFVSCFAVALIAVFGLVVDGGLVLASRRQAFNAADAAARAGAQAIDESGLRSGRPVSLDEREATRRALEHLRLAGLTGTAEVDGDRITVHTSTVRSLSILGFAGVGPITVRASGSARAVQAVRDGEG